MSLQCCKNMAKKMLLISPGVFERYKTLAETGTNPPEAVQGNKIDDTLKPETKIDIINPTPNVTEHTVSADLLKFAEILPKNMRSRARILLSSLEGKIKLEEGSNRVTYDDNESVGSHIIDHLRYVLSPLKMKSPRPLDSEMFYKLLQKTGVPESVFSRNVESNDKMDVPIFYTLYG